MGRTKRTRNRKRRSKSENSTDDIVRLTRWMGKVQWKNIAKIKCHEFEQTGRGVKSSKSISSGDVLINVPYKLLITYSTIVESEEFLDILKLNSKFGIHDLLAAFLVVEKHKGSKSCWKYYINSLPNKEPKLPWFSSLEEIQCCPDELRVICESCRLNFQKSWIRLSNSIDPNWLCPCCGKHADGIVNFADYVWGYTMVNTRGVYVDPDVVKNFSKCVKLLDDPNIALCPLMDMFNHSDTSENITKFNHTKKGTFYELVTFEKFQKHEQIFICYGRHNNLKLFTEYGFYLSKNSNDKLKFNPDEILKVLSFKFSNFQYDFLTKHQFLNCDELFVSLLGVSFKLKGFLFVGWNENERNYGLTIFGEKYSDAFLDVLKDFIKKLIQYKKVEYRLDIDRFSEKFCDKNILNFLHSRLEFVQNLDDAIKYIY